MGSPILGRSRSWQTSLRRSSHQHRYHGQSAAPAHDRGHDCPQAGASRAEKLLRELQTLCGIPRALAGHRDGRRFQLHLIENGLSVCNRNRVMTGVGFLFRVTLRRHDLAAEVFHLKEPQRLPLVMSPEEASNACSPCRANSRSTSCWRSAMAAGCGRARSFD